MEDNNINEIIYLVQEDNTLIKKEDIKYFYEKEPEIKNMIICEYIGLFCRMPDVVKITNMNSHLVQYVAPGDENEPYYYSLEYPGNPYPWRDKNGSLKFLYDELENRGVTLSTTMYKDIRENKKSYQKSKRL